jgi:hypothetical protein
MPFHRRTGLLLLSVASLTAVLRNAPVTAQSTSARPTVAVTSMPTMALNLWPADFNKDGKLDLVAGRPIGVRENFGRGGELVLRLGNGDGTFGPEQVIATPTMAAPLGVGDFNGDGNTDLVAIDTHLAENEEPQVRPVWVLAGNGDGTFGSAMTVDTFSTPWFRYQYVPSTFALVTDFDGDGRADLAIAVDPDLPLENPAADDDAVHFYRGNGDLTFEAAGGVTTGSWPKNGVVSDFNGDGKPDMAVAARDGHQVDVFLNLGGFLFAASSIRLDRSALDVTATDLNRDGKADLIVSAGSESVDYVGDFFNGRVLTMAGNGDGSFQPPVSVETPPGPVKIAAGDFNRDGFADIATGNYDLGGQEECGSLWGSVSILPGNGAGSLGTPASFQLSYDFADSDFARRLHSLNAAAVDGDAHTDLIASGAILFNRAAAPNRLPIANAGPDQTRSEPYQSMSVTGEASDPDHDLLTYRWTDEAGRVVGDCVLATFTTPGPGEHTYTFTVTDGRGGTASDSMIVTDTVPITSPGVNIEQPQFDKPVPAEDPYPIRFTTVPDSNNTPVVDVDISVDRNGQTNFVPIPECTNLPASVTECVWKDPGQPSNDAALLFRVTDAQGDSSQTVVRFQIVQAVSGPLPSGWLNRDVGAVAAPGGAATDGSAFLVRGSGADIWGTADEFHWAYTSMTGDFQAIARVAFVENVDVWTKAGLMIRESAAAGSRHASIFATPTTAKPMAFQRRPATNGTTLHTAGPFITAPVWLMLRRTGDVISAWYRVTPTQEWIAVGTQTLTGLPPTVQVGLPVSSHVDGTRATARFENVSFGSSAPPALQVLRPREGEQVQVNAPYWIRWMPAASDASIARFDLFFSQQQEGPWSPIAGCTNVAPERRSCVWHRPNPLGEGYVRVAATTRDGTQGEGRSGAFHIVLNASGPGGMPPGWLCGDLGAVAVAGSCAYEVDDELVPDFVVRGSGSDIWGTSDELSFAAFPAYGDFAFTARVVGVENVDRWTKVGVMIRDWDGETPAFEEGSGRHASFLVTPTTEKGTAFQRRPTSGGPSVHTAGPVSSAPIWLRLVRSGDMVHAYYRKAALDAWTLVGSQTFTNLPYQTMAMLVVSSHVDGTLATGRFDNVVVEEVKPLQSADIGTTIPGTTSSEGVETTIEGDGGDIWGTADAFRFHYMPWHGDGWVIARVRNLENTHAWAKAGVMIRESLSPGSKHVMAIVSPSRGAAMQYRTVTGGMSAGATPLPAATPGWLLLRRFGDRFEAGWSTDGEFWHSLGTVTISMGAEVYLGLPVTSHAPGTLATAVFDDVVIRP